MVLFTAKQITLFSKLLEYSLLIDYKTTLLKLNKVEIWKYLMKFFLFIS